MKKIVPNKIDQIAELKNIIAKHEIAWAEEIAKERGTPNDKEKILRRIRERGRRNVPKGDK
jgi:hypothetical protein